MALTLGEAAKQVTASKSTLLRAIKSGRLSATKARGSDAWAIDPAELFRVFDPVPSKARPQAPETVSEGPGLAEKDATNDDGSLKPEFANNKVSTLYGGRGYHRIGMPVPQHTYVNSLSYLPHTFVGAPCKNS